MGRVFLLAILARIFWRRTEKLRAQLITGGAILRKPRELLVRVALPELGSYLAKLGVIAVFLGAYGIPVTFQNVATVAASNSISNSVSVTPGGVGVNQAMNTAALRNETSKSQRDGLLGRSAADHHGLERRLRRGHRQLGVRLDRRAGSWSTPPTEMRRYAAGR